MGFLVPALAGYIAYAIADRPGIAPGFVAGAVAGFMGAGFLGGIVGGLLAGYIAHLIGTWQVPRWLRGLMPVVIIPLLASIVASGLMFLVLGGPIAGLTTGLNTWLSGMTGASAVVLGIILGLMMCFDLGGPVNKVAYAFAVAGLSAGSADQPGTVADHGHRHGSGHGSAAGHGPGHRPGQEALQPGRARKRQGSLAAGRILHLRRRHPVRRSRSAARHPRQHAGRRAHRRPHHGHQASRSQAPHGGIFVFFAIGNVLMFIVSIIAGTVVSALAVVALKRWAVKKTVDTVEPVPVTV